MEQAKNKKPLWVAEIPSDDTYPMEEDGEIQTFETPEAALHEGKNMWGVNYEGMAFIVRRLAESDIPMEIQNYEEIIPEKYKDVALITSRDDRKWLYPAYVGMNGADWVRMQYMNILFQVLQGEVAHTRFWADQLPAADPNKEKLMELLEGYLARE